MRKTTSGFLLASAVLTVLCVTLRRFELAVLLDESGLQVFTPLSILLIAAAAAAALFYVLFALKCLPKSCELDYSGAFSAKTPVPLCLALIGMLLGFVMCWQFFLLWKQGGSVLLLPLAMVSALSGVSGVYLEFAALGKNSASPAALMTAGWLLTLQPVCMTLFFYKKNAPEPSLLLILYSVLALCAAILARYYITGSIVRRLKPVRACVACGLSFIFGMTALLQERNLLYAAAFVSYALSAADFGIRLIDRTAAGNEGESFINHK